MKLKILLSLWEHVTKKKKKEPKCNQYVKTIFRPMTTATTWRSLCVTLSLLLKNDLLLYPRRINLSFAIAHQPGLSAADIVFVGNLKLYWDCPHSISFVPQLLFLPLNSPYGHFLSIPLSFILHTWPLSGEVLKQVLLLILPEAIGVRQGETWWTQP